VRQEIDLCVFVTLWPLHLCVLCASVATYVS